MINLFKFISEISNPFLNDIFNLITSSYFLIPVIICIILLVEENKKNKLNKKSAVFLVILPVFLAVILTALSTTIIKDAVNEDRPCKTIQYIDFPFCQDSNSFPSRHTAIAFAALPFLVHSRKYFTVFFVYAIIVGLGMIYLGQHYPHDVLAGFIIGFGIGYLFLLKKRWIAEKCSKIFP